MIEYQEDRELGRVFAALSDHTRRAIIRRLAEAPLTVSEIAEPFDSSLQAVSMHLKVLERAGLLIRKVEGRVHHCQLDHEPLVRASRWAAQITAQRQDEALPASPDERAAEQGQPDATDVVKQNSLMIGDLVGEIQRFDSSIRRTWDLETED